MKPKKKPIASLSLNLDNQWAHMKFHGEPGWETFPSYLNLVLPRILDFMKERGLKITIFVTGQDAALEKNRAAIAAISQAGHEIGTRFFYDETWPHLQDENAIDHKIALAEDHIYQVTGQHPIGFRGVGFSLSPVMLRVLSKRGYQYDASTFPTFLGPLMRACYFATTDLTSAEREERKALFGPFKNGLQPLTPYRWSLDSGPSDESGFASGRASGQLTEIPITTMPIFKLPIHFSYLLFLSAFSSKLALLYLQLALWLCKRTKTQPSLLLHPLDFLGYEDCPELTFLPGTKLHRHQKLTVLSKTIHILTRQFEVLPIGQHAQVVAAGQLPVWPGVQELTAAAD